MKISVIIPTYNEKEVILNCLESLNNQTFKDLPVGKAGFEIIVVDDGSVDKTSEVLRNLQLTINTRQASASNFQFFEQNHKGAGVARNLGAKHAIGQILVFVDADMTFDQYFLEKLTDPILQAKVNGTFSKEEFVNNWENAWARCWNIQEGWEVKRRHPKNYPDTQPVFRAILKSEFDKVGGFTPGGYDDDWSLSKKLEYEAVSAPDAIFYHKNPNNLLEIFNHAKWIGKRKYKFGLFGYLIALVRSSFPISLVLGMIKSIMYRESAFVVFKIVYDFGIFFGILEYLSLGKQSK